MKKVGTSLSHEQAEDACHGCYQVSSHKLHKHPLFCQKLPSCHAERQTFYSTLHSFQLLTREFGYEDVHGHLQDNGIENNQYILGAHTHLDNKSFSPLHYPMLEQIHMSGRNAYGISCIQNYPQKLDKNEVRVAEVPLQKHKLRSFRIVISSLVANLLTYFDKLCGGAVVMY